MCLVGSIILLLLRMKQCVVVLPEAGCSCELGVLMGSTKELTALLVVVCLCFKQWEVAVFLTGACFGATEAL